MGKEDKPCGRRSAYALFVKTCREEHKNKHPDVPVVFAEFSRKCAGKWETISEKEKTRFHQLAEKDKKRYESEMANYIPTDEGRGKGGKRKRTKDPNAPKRSLSAFFLFSRDERPKVKDIMQDASVGDIAKELGRRWKEASTETKKRYEQHAAKDKAQYMKDVEAYKSGGAKKPKVASMPKKVEDEDEEESGEEEEEEEEPEAESEEEEEDDE